MLYNRIVNFLDGADFFGFLPRSSTTSAVLAAVSKTESISTRGVTLQQYLSMSRRHSTVLTIIYCSQNIFDVEFVGMDLKSFKIIFFARTQVISSSRGANSSKFMTRGIPQGQSFSALLFPI
jgi:hypothetical protein